MKQEIKTIKIGIVGFGTVGTGVASILLEKRKEILFKHGIDLEIKYIADTNLKLDRGIKLADGVLINDSKKIIEDNEIDIIVEVVGGKDFAYSLLDNALDKGKNVVTANKALLAEKGSSLFLKAAKNNKIIGFEAAVAGGIPIIRAMRDGLVGNDISAIYGILNGTANFVLTKMSKDNMEFSAALKEAQELGFAEADPTFDVEGFDAAHKICLLASLAYGKYYPYEDISVKGISSISALDFKNAHSMGYEIKLIASCKKDINGSPLISVEPVLLDRDSSLAKIDYEFNSIYVLTDNTGPTQYIGKGAGSLPTGSAIVADIVEIAKSISRESTSIPFLIYSDDKPGKIASIDTQEFQSYIRMEVSDNHGVLSKISGIFGNNSISIASMQQIELDKKAMLVFKTHNALGSNLKIALKEIKDSKLIMGEIINLTILSDI